jgi:ribosomal protein L16 Arg81 hydroxylase
MSVFAELLNPYPPDVFFRENWTQKSVVISGQNAQKFADLFSWKQLNELLNFHEFDYPILRLAKDEEVLHPNENANFLKHCQNGATLILDRVHKFVPAIADLTTKLRSEIGHPVQTNMYCSSPATQGFRCHYDTHEVLILQIDGCKQWHVFDQTVQYPLVEQKSAALVPPSEPPYLSCVLQPGDLLYIPRGHWHYAVAQDQPSLHLTLGVLCKTGIDFLAWLTEDLKQQALWRENLPLRSNFTTTALSDHVDTLLENLKHYLEQKCTEATYTRYFASLEPPIATYAFPHQLGFNIFEQGIYTRFRKPNHQRMDVVTESSEDHIYQLIAGSKEITLKGIPKTCLDNLCDRSQFSGVEVRDWLPDFDWEAEIAPMLTNLVKLGILLVDESS